MIFGLSMERFLGKPCFEEGEPKKSLGKVRLAIIAVFLVGIMSGLTISSFAYVLWGIKWSDDSLPVSWEVNELWDSQWVQTARNSYAAWDDVSGCRFDSNYVGTTSRGGGLDYHNVVYYTIIDNDYVGLTTAWAQDGAMIDVDIYLNGKYFFDFDGSVGYDVQSVITHEVGHFVGLDHSYNSAATMYTGTGSPSGTWRRSLHQDDIDGARYLYPQSVNQAPNAPSVPTGPSTGDSGIAHSFSATATDLDGDQVAFKFSWGDGTESGWTSFVNSGSSASISHSWSGQGTYQVRAKAKDVNGAESGWSGAHEIVIGHPPNTPSAPTGPDSGRPNTSYDFTASSTDPDGDQVAFRFDWGDGTESYWTSFVNSGGSASMSHSWSSEGTFEVKAKAKDSYGSESGWSTGHQIATGQAPNTPAAPSGESSGILGTSYGFTASSTDPDGDQVALKFDWGDGNESGWSSFADSGSSVSMSHSWSSEGTFQVKAQSKDIYGAESGWSAGHGITIILSQPPATPAPPSSDGGTREPGGISYTFTTTTTDPEGEQIAFEFDWGDGTGSGWTSFVDSGSSVSMSHTWSVQGTLEVKVRAKDTHSVESGWSASLTIVTGGAPNTPAAPSGPDRGGLGSSHSFTASSIDPDGDQVALKFDWGDGNESGWSSFADSGSSVSMSHSWSSEGTFQVKAQSKDIYGAESGWSAGHGIEILEGYHENETFSLPAGKWKMVSIPFTLDDPSPNAVLVDDLGEQNDAVWKLYRWNTTNESYDKYPNTGNFSPGVAFWTISKDAKTVDTGPGRDVSKQTDFVINLLSGWTQFANPFPFSIDWNEVKVRRNGEVVSILEAQARGWLRDKIWYWDGQSYLVYQAPSGTVDPYEGYWAKALLDCELMVPPVEAQGAEASEQAINSKEEFLQLKAKAGELEDNFNFLGFSESAKDGYDRLDIEEAPPISPYISLFFPHPEWEKNEGDYTQDIRTGSSQTGPKWFWDFQIKTDQVRKEVILEWENASAISEELHLYLTDSLGNVLADMRENNSYRFALPSELESFRIIVTYKVLPLPEDLNLTEVHTYPNPAHGAGLRFHFHLASWAKVTIKIYTIAGELVRTLVEDEVLLAGAHEELWEEKNDKGEKLARGVYIFIVQAGNPAKVISKSGKIALLE